MGRLDATDQLVITVASRLKAVAVPLNPVADGEAVTLTQRIDRAVDGQAAAPRRQRVHRNLLAHILDEKIEDQPEAREDSRPRPSFRMARGNHDPLLPALSTCRTLVDGALLLLFIKGGRAIALIGIALSTRALGRLLRALFIWRFHALLIFGLAADKGVNGFQIPDPNAAPLTSDAQQKAFNLSIGV